MTVLDLEKRFLALGDNYRTADVDRLNKQLIKERADVSCLRNIVLEKQQYHRTYFQVSLNRRASLAQKLDFIEDNFYKLQDWWHVDQLTQFIGKNIDFDLCYRRSAEYVKHPHIFARRWGYVIFMPELVKGDHFEDIIKLFREDEEYYVVMAEAWLISYLAIYHPQKTLEWMKEKPLKYNIVGRAIQKICDSYRISSENKEKFKELRKLYK